MPTTIHNTGITFPDLTTQTTAASAGGQLQTELFTTPGTWTKPASATQVRVTVIGGGGGGSSGTGTAPSGGTSSFGPAVSATGGAGSPGNAVGGNGSGTVSVGTALKTGDILSSFPAAPPFTNATVFLGIINGNSTRTPAVPGLKPSVAYSASSINIAGARGNGTNTPGGAGGYAIAMVPVSAPVTVTIGTGGSGAGPAGPSWTGGVDGAVLVEFVG